MRNDRDAYGRTQAVILRGEAAAKRQADAKNIEVVAAHQLPEERFGETVCVNRHRHLRVGRERGERPAVAQVEVIRIGRAGVAVVAGGCIDGDEAIRIGDRRVAQENRVDGAEDGRVRADPKGQRRDDCRGKSRRTQQCPHCVAKIAAEVGQHKDNAECRMLNAEVKVDLYFSIQHSNFSIV